MREINTPFLRVGLGCLGLGVFALLWQLLPAALEIKIFVLPPLDTVISRFILDFETLADAASRTAQSTLWAVLIAYGVAFLLAAIYILIPVLYLTVEPLVVAGQAIPKAVFVPLLYIAISDKYIPGVVIGSLIAFFPVFMAIKYSIETLPRSVTDLSVIWGYGRLTYFLRIAMPFAIPAAFSFLGMAWIYALIGVVTTELIHTGIGIGKWLTEAYNNRLDSSLYYASVLASLMVGAIGWSFGSLVDYFIRRRFRLSRPAEGGL